MFIIKLLSQHVSGIIMPGHHYAHRHENKRVHCHIWCSALVVMAVVVWSWDATTAITTICGSAHSCSPDDGHNDARNMLR